MIAYTSRTGTLSTLAALRANGWRQLIAPGQRPSSGHTAGWMLDNGAWSAHQRGRVLCGKAFLRHLVAWGRYADMVVVPDIVAGGAASLALSRRWLLPCLHNCRLALVPVQAGMTPADVHDLVDHRSGNPPGWPCNRVGLFVGGSTDWKLGTLPMWGRFAREHDVWLHVGRVNSVKRIQACREAGADSFDGKSPVMFPSTLPLLDSAHRQVGLLHHERRHQPRPEDG